MTDEEMKQVEQRFILEAPEHALKLLTLMGEGVDGMTHLATPLAEGGHGLVVVARGQRSCSELYAFLQWWGSRRGGPDYTSTAVVDVPGGTQ